jgi:hypothetical protein
MCFSYLGNSNFKPSCTSLFLNCKNFSISLISFLVPTLRLYALAFSMGSDENCSCIKMEQEVWVTLQIINEWRFISRKRADDLC